MEDRRACHPGRKARTPRMPRQVERKTVAHAMLGRTEDRHTYRRPHRTGRKTAGYEGSLPHIPQATPGRKEDDNDDAMPGMKKDDNNDTTPSMKEDEHDESVGITCAKRHRDTSSDPRSLKKNERMIPCYIKDHWVAVSLSRRTLEEVQVAM